MFKLYDFITTKQSKKSFIETSKNISDETYLFIREINENNLVCDQYSNENILENHVEIPIEQIGEYELKKVKSTFKIRTREATSTQFVDEPKVFNTIQEILEAVPTGTFWVVWKAEIVCDVDCRRLGIDPSSDALWPPKPA